MSRRESIIIRVGKVVCFMTHKLPPTTATAPQWHKDFYFKEVLKFILPKSDSNFLSATSASSAPFLIRFWLSSQRKKNTICQCDCSLSSCSDFGYPSSCYGLMEHHAGRTGGQKEQKGPYAVTVTCSLLSLAAIIFCLPVSSESADVWKGTKLPSSDIKHHTAQKVFETDPTASGLLRLSWSLLWETGHPHQ